MKSAVFEVHSGEASKPKKKQEVSFLWGIIGSLILHGVAGYGVISYIFPILFPATVIEPQVFMVSYVPIAENQEENAKKESIKTPFEEALPITNEPKPDIQVKKKEIVLRETKTASIKKNNVRSNRSESTEPATQGRLNETSASTTAASMQSTAATYQQLVAAHIAGHKQYPARARMRGIEGKVTISLTLGKKGEVDSVTVVSSDSTLLSDGVETMINQAAPFPSIPPEIGKEEVTLQVPIRFDLK